jgi:hypothetical protein
MLLKLDGTDTRVNSGGVAEWKKRAHLCCAIVCSAVRNRLSKTKKKSVIWMPLVIL